ncbi:MAG TPA: hypothetical protein VLT33_18260 [Labilithrix sp.]|nr:hypothetical protein [Labilithrix sp.]
MGRSAGQPARVDGVDRPQVASRAKVAAPRPVRPAAAETHTVREILPPWHLLEAQLQKREEAVAIGALVPAEAGALDALAAQEAENAHWLPADAIDEVEAPPSSGVRVSDPRLGVVTPVADSLLTFKVYTLAELESRGDAPLSMRVSQANFDSTAARSASRWRRVFAALCAFGAATVAWWKTAGGRPDPRVALRQPFDRLGDELQVAVEAVDWKKHGVTTGIVVGATFTLLFGVLTAAELTDDLKPGTTAHLATSEVAAPRAPQGKAVAPASNMAALGVQPVAPPVSAIAPPSQELGDVDDADPEPAPVPAKRAAKKKPKSNKLTFRNADAVFNP